MRKLLTEKNILYLVWLQALAATLGSLFFSEIWHLPPCTLCWYQRIFMYPLTLIIPLGTIRKDKNLPDYILLLAIPGLIIAAFHNLLYYGIVPESQAPCALGVSCTTKFFEWFGFVTIPFLSMLAFALIVGLVLLYKRIGKK